MKYIAMSVLSGLCCAAAAAQMALATPACSVSEDANRHFTVRWNDSNVFKYVVERVVDDRSWYWRGRMYDDNRANYSFVDDTQPIAATGSIVQYRLQTRVDSDSSPLQQPVVCTPGVNGGPQRTAEVNGRWEIVDSDSGGVVRWEAVNIRSDRLAQYPIDRGDIEALSERFNSIRLSIHWSQMERGNNSYDTELLARIRDILDWSGEFGIHVILDPVHLGGDDRFWIPDWVWRTVLPGQSPSRSKSFDILRSGEIRDYLDWIMAGSGLGMHPAVVAIEVVNEPHPPGSRDAWRTDTQIALLNEYQRMIDVIRAHRPGVIVVLGAFYGGTLFDNGLQPPRNALAEVFANTPNLVWTAHNYFTGIESPASGPDYDNDGAADVDGQGWRGTRGAGVWGESWKSAGCYTETQRRDPNSDWSCEAGLPGRAQAREGHANNAANHDRVAQQARMPFFMGEWGINRIRLQNIDGDSAIEKIGWGGAAEFVCDKLRAYQDPYRDGSNRAISWAAWAFDARVDGGFGLYDGGANRWLDDMANAFRLDSGCRY